MLRVHSDLQLDKSHFTVFTTSNHTESMVLCILDDFNKSNSRSHDDCNLQRLRNMRYTYENDWINGKNIRQSTKKKIPSLFAYIFYMAYMFYSFGISQSIVLRNWKNHAPLNFFFKYRIIKFISWEEARVIHHRKDIFVT